MYSVVVQLNISSSFGTADQDILIERLIIVTHYSFTWANHPWIFYKQSNILQGFSPGLLKVSRDTDSILFWDHFQSTSWADTSLY